MAVEIPLKALLVGGKWTSVYSGKEEDDGSTRNWVMRNNIQPSLQILDIDLIARHNRGSRYNTLQNMGKFSNHQLIKKYSQN